MKTEVRDAASWAASPDDTGTRERVMALIMARGATTAADVAQVLDITPAAVRRHLASLVEKGLVTTRERRHYGVRERGRPAKVYVPTDAGRADFAQAYDQLAVDALRYLQEQAGDQAVAVFARRRFAAIEERYSAEMSDHPESSALEALTKLLSEDGFMAAVHPVRSGEQLCQHHCPVANVAAEFPELCVAEAEVFGRLLGSHVQRLATIAHGDGVCTLHVPHPVRPDQHDQQKESA